MIPLNEELREIRVEKGITLEQISKVTKIRVDMLERLDIGDYTFVPKPYLRAFIREYAQIVGINPDLAMNRLDNRISSLRDPWADQSAGHAPAEERPNTTPVRTVPLPAEPLPIPETAAATIPPVTFEAPVAAETASEPPVEIPEPPEPATAKPARPSAVKASKPRKKKAPPVEAPSPETVEPKPEVVSAEPAAAETGVSEPISPLSVEFPTAAEPVTPTGFASPESGREPRKPLVIPEPKTANALFFIVFLILIITAAAVIIWLQR